MSHSQKISGGTLPPEDHGAEKPQTVLLEASQNKLPDNIQNNITQHLIPINFHRVDQKPIPVPSLSCLPDRIFDIDAPVHTIES